MMGENSVAQLRRRDWSGPHPLLSLAFAIFIIWGFGFETVGRRLVLALDGDITTERFIPRNWHSHGPGMVYIVRAADGTEQQYTAGGNDSSLPLNLPVGHISKSASGNCRIR
jgi:hypothetical protein